MNPILVGVVAVLETIAVLADRYPDLVQKLASEVGQLLEQDRPHPEAVKALVAGLAAARATAVQEAQRRRTA